MQINAYSTRADACPHGFTAIDERPRWTRDGQLDQTLIKHLADFTAFTDQRSDPLDPTGLALRHHLRDVQRAYCFDIDISDTAQLRQLNDWAEEANAVLVADGAVLDPQGRPLLPGSHGNPTGRVPIMPEATQRAALARMWLGEAKNIQVPPALPPVRSLTELTPRDGRTTALRTIALVMVADFASSVTAGNPLDPNRMRQAFPQSFEVLTPAERDLLASRDPHAALQLSWRIEAAQELLWALGRTTLDWPAHSCVTEQVKSAVLARGEQAFLADAALIQLAGLLDEYEGLYSVSWALDRAHSRGGSIPGTDAEVVSERLSALSWLLNRDIDWDDADTRDHYPAELAV